MNKNIIKTMDNGNQIVTLPNGKQVIFTHNELQQVINNYIQTCVNTQIVGYQIVVNNEIFQDKNWCKQYMFKTKDDAIRWLHIFGYGSDINLNEDYTQIIELSLHQASGLEYIDVPQYTDDIEEYCPFCGEEVLLKSVFSNQPCPHCGQLISPCSLCNKNVCLCSLCPLQSILFKK